MVACMVAFAAQSFLHHFLQSNKADRLLRQYSTASKQSSRRVQSKIVLDIKGVGISIIADHSALGQSDSYELLYISLSDMLFWHELDNQKRMNIEAHIDSFQIDSAARDTNYPVLL